MRRHRYSVNAPARRGARAAAVEHETATMGDAHVGAGIGHRRRDGRARHRRRGTRQTRVETAHAEHVIAIAKAAHAGPRGDALARRAEVGIDAHQAGDAHQQRPGGGVDLHFDMGGRFELDDATNQAEVLRRDALMHQHQRTEGELVIEGQHGVTLGARNHFVAEQRQQLDPLGLAEDQGVADHRVAADQQAGHQRVVLDVEIHAQQGAHQAAQPKAFEHHDLAAAHATVGGDVERQAQAAAGAVVARQIARAQQPFAPAVFGQRRVEGHPSQPPSHSSDSCGNHRRIARQMGGGDAILERGEHALDVAQQALQEICRRGLRTVGIDRPASSCSDQLAVPSRTRQRLPAVPAPRRAPPRPARACCAVRRAASRHRDRRRAVHRPRPR